MIAVTGGAGFIGSVLVSTLAEREADVLVVDTLGSAGKFKNLRAKRTIDIVEPGRFAAGLEAGSYSPDVILHMGARTDTSEADADLMMDKNVRYTSLLAETAMRRNIRFIYASSASVYGNGAQGFNDAEELTAGLLPLNPYAFSKWLFDMRATAYGWTRQIVGLRFFNVFGPNEYHKGRMASVIWHAVNQVNASGKMQLFRSHKPGYADGEQLRDFVYVRDLVRVVMWFVDHPDVNGIFNLGTGRARTFNALSGAIFAALGKTPTVEYVPTPDNIKNAYQYYTQADLTRLRSVGCDVEFMTLESAVQDYVQGFLKQDNPYL